MKDKFDAYHKWLGIPPGEHPPNHYRLLGIQLYESDLGVIDHAASRQCLQLKSVQTGPHGRLSQQLLNEVSAARLCLLDPQKRADYDAHLAASAAGPFVASAAKRSVSSAARRKKPAGQPIIEIVKIVGGSVAGLFLAVLILSYFADIDLLGWKPKKTAAQLGPAKDTPAATIAPSRVSPAVQNTDLAAKPAKQVAEMSLPRDSSPNTLSSPKVNEARPVRESTARAALVNQESSPDSSAMPASVPQESAAAPIPPSELKAAPAVTTGSTPGLAENSVEPAIEFTEAEKRATAILAKMNREFSAYRLEILAARRLMFKSFDDAETKVQNSKTLAAGSKNPMLARLAEERKAFEAAGYLPFSAPMRTSWSGYLSKRKRADDTLRAVFDKQIAATFKAKESEVASLLQKQRDLCFAPTVVARWNTAGWTLHSDLTAHHDRLGTGTWQMKGDAYVINWDPNPNSSVDICQLHVLGNSFEGQNSQGYKVQGQWLPPLVDQSPVDSDGFAWKQADLSFVQFRHSIERVWAEFAKGTSGPVKTWLEVGRTDDYVELQEDGKDRFVRLYKDRAEEGEGSAAQRRWLAESKGAWENEGNSEPVIANAIRKPSLGRAAKGEIPSIEGEWTAKYDGKRIFISQKGGRIAVVSEYQDAKGGGQVRWEGEGTITKEGKIEMVINAMFVAKSDVRVQNRTGRLSLDGKTIIGVSASSTGEGGDYTWTRVGPDR